MKPFACGTAAGCVRVIDLNYRCRIGNERMKLMSNRSDCAGPSLLEQLWNKLCEAYDDLLTQMHNMEQEPADDNPRDDYEQLGRLKGICVGLATSIALITNPYHPDVDAVRAEIADRHEEWERHR